MRCEAGVRGGERRQVAYPVSVHAKVDSILHPGNDLKGVNQTHDRVNARNHHKPHKEYLTSLLPLITPSFPRTSHKGSREYQRENVDKCAHTDEREKYT